jgi:hypothetical protein
LKKKEFNWRRSQSEVVKAVGDTRNAKRGPGFMQTQIQKK